MSLTDPVKRGDRPKAIAEQLRTHPVTDVDWRADRLRATYSVPFLPSS